MAFVRVEADVGSRHLPAFVLRRLSFARHPNVPSLVCERRQCCSVRNLSLRRIGWEEPKVNFSVDNFSVSRETSIGYAPLASRRSAFANRSTAATVFALVMLLAILSFLHSVL